MLATVPDIAEIGVDALERKLPDALVLDVREPEEYARGHVPGAINVPQAELASRRDELPRGRAILTICQSGGSLAASGTVSQADGLRSGSERQRRYQGLARGGQATCLWRYQRSREATPQGIQMGPRWCVLATANASLGSL